MNTRQTILVTLMAFFLPFMHSSNAAPHVQSISKGANSLVAIPPVAVNVGQLIQIQLVPADPTHFAIKTVKAPVGWDKVTGSPWTYSRMFSPTDPSDTLPVFFTGELERVQQGGSGGTGGYEDLDWTLAGDVDAGGAGYFIANDQAVSVVNLASSQANPKQASANYTAWTTGNVKSQSNWTVDEAGKPAGEELMFTTEAVGDFVVKGTQIVEPQPSDVDDFIVVNYYLEGPDSIYKSAFAVEGVDVQTNVIEITLEKENFDNKFNDHFGTPKNQWSSPKGFQHLGDTWFGKSALQPSANAGDAAITVTEQKTAIFYTKPLTVRVLKLPLIEMPPPRTKQFYAVPPAPDKPAGWYFPTLTNAAIADVNITDHPDQQYGVYGLALLQLRDQFDAAVPHVAVEEAVTKIGTHDGPNLADFAGKTSNVEGLIVDVLHMESPDPIPAAGFDYKQVISLTEAKDNVYIEIVNLNFKSNSITRTKVSP